MSAVIIAVKNIYGFFKKPVDSIQGRARANEESHIKEVVTATIDELKSFMVQALNDRFNEL